MDYFKKQGDSGPDPNEQGAVTGKIDRDQRNRGAGDEPMDRERVPEDRDNNFRDENDPYDVSLTAESDSMQNTGRGLSRDPQQEPQPSSNSGADDEIDLSGRTYTQAADEPDQDSDLLSEFPESNESVEEDDHLFDLYEDQFESPSSAESDDPNDSPEHETQFREASEASDEDEDTFEYPYDIVERSMDSVARREILDELHKPWIESGPHGGADPEAGAEPSVDAVNLPAESHVGDESLPDLDWVFEDNAAPDLDFDSVNPILPERLASSGLNDSVASGTEQDIGPVDDSRSIEKVYDPWADSEYENAFFRISNDPTARSSRSPSGDPPQDDSPDQAGFYRMTRDQRGEFPQGKEAGELEDDLEQDPTASLSSGFTAIDPHPPQDDVRRSGARRDAAWAPESRGNVEPGADVSNFRGGISETSNVYREDDTMTWLTKGILGILTTVVIVMGGFLYNLQSQIDELHLLLPLDRENPFSGEAGSAPDLANDSVIKNINARIDNLSDTLELIAVANQQEDPSINQETSGQPGSEAPQAGPGRTENRVAAVLAGKAEISEINLRVDRLEKSFEAVRRAGGQPESAGKLIADPEATEVPADEMITEPVQPAAVAEVQNERPALTEETRPKSSARKKPPEPAAAVAKPKAPQKPGATGEWSVNLMSLTEMAIAKKERERCLKKGVSAEIQPTRVSGRTWYRLRVGGFKTKPEAQQFADSAKKKLGLASTWVTR